MEDVHKFVVRLPMPLRDRIAEAARFYRRSMNSEIVARLEQSFAGLPDSYMEDRVTPQHFNDLFTSHLSADDEQLLRAFRRLPADKREALLKLLS